MRHDPFTGVFNGAYLNHRVRFNVQDAFLEEDLSDNGLTRIFTHMSITCNENAPAKIPKEVINAPPPDPEILELKRRHDELKHIIQDRYKYISRAPNIDIVREYKELGTDIRNKKKERVDSLNKEYRKQFLYHSHNKEMERQLNKTKAEKYIAPVIQHQLPERTQLQEVVCDFRTGLSVEDIVKRRIRAINLMIALGARQEVRPRKERSITPDDDVKEESLDSLPFLDADCFPLICKKTQCIYCIGNERLPFQVRIHSFCRISYMWDHVEDHLSKEPAGQPVSCRHPVCKANEVVLNNVNRFKNHVQTVHGISLRPPKCS